MLINLLTKCEINIIWQIICFAGYIKKAQNGNTARRPAVASERIPGAAL